MIHHSHMLDAYALGATLYMPIIHPKVPEILSGRAACPSSSIVLCLENALQEGDVERGISVLKTVLMDINHRPDLKVFVRPRSLEMAHRLAAFHGIDQMTGFVAPKIRPETAAEWFDAITPAGLQIMPTLETAEFFDPARIVALRDVFNGFDHRSVAAIRLGGNDLLGALGLRRERGVTSWEGPLAGILTLCSGLFISSGYPVAAPVFDIFDDLETLAREVQRDIAFGFISKTAIHPTQVFVIEDAMRVSPEETRQASAILDKDAKAVFQIGGVMCEPSTHQNWAHRIQARKKVFGETGRRLRSEIGLDKYESNL